MDQKIVYRFLDQLEAMAEEIRALELAASRDLLQL